MSEIFAVQLTAVATLALAILALATAVLAFMAWRKQSGEVRDQAEMLRVQSEQLAEDRKINAEQIRVLGLQAEELERVAREKRRAQAVQVYMHGPRVELSGGSISYTVRLRNTSVLPVYDPRFAWDLGGRFAAIDFPRSLVFTLAARLPPAGETAPDVR